MTRDPADRAVPAASPPAAEESEGPDIRAFLSMLHRHRWAAILAFVVAVGVGAVNTLRAERVYSSTPALLEITSDGGGISTVRGVFEREMITAQNFETLVQVLKSESILRAAYEDAPEVQAKMEYPTFAGCVSAIPGRNCYLVRITFESPWPEVNPIAANSVARAFLRVVREQRENRTSRAGRQLETRRDELRKKLEEAEDGLAAFRAKHEWADVRAEKLAVDVRVTAMEADFDKGQIELLRLERDHNEVEAARKADNLGQISQVLDDLTYQELERSIRETEAKKSEELRDKKEEHHIVKLLDERLGYLNRSLQARANTIVGKIETSFEEARSSLRKLGEARDALRKEQHDLGMLVIELTNLETERDRVRGDLDELARQASDVVGGAGFDLSPGVLHEEAQVSMVPVRPRHSRDIVVAMFLGVLLAVGVAYVFEQFNDSVSRPEEVARVTGLPVLGMLPRRSSSSSDEPDLSALKDPQGEVSEAVRIIRTSILFTPSGRTERRKILVTSAEPGEGKTLFATNLAVALSQAGQRTMLVDGDLRRPRLHKVFGLGNDRGLTHIFTNGQVKPPTNPVAVDEGSTLDVVLSGPIPPNPAELIGGRRMTEFLDVASHEYDRVVIDCPPAGPVSDPALLARQVDSVILVVHLGRTSVRSLRRACDHLQKVGAPLLGVVLNGVTMGGGYHYYYSRYGSGSGSDAKERGRRAPREG